MPDFFYEGHNQVLEERNSLKDQLSEANRKIADLENLKLKSALQNQTLEKSLLTAENAYLKSQINPHFLLNTLKQEVTKIKKK